MATAVFTPVVSRALGDPLTVAIWTDQIQDDMNQLAGAHRQLLTNGGFEVWQRGVGPFTTTATYGPDRWLLTVGATTLTVTKETTTVGAGSAASLKAVSTGAGVNNLSQKVEDFAQLRGRDLSLSVRVHQSLANAVTLQIADDAGNTSSATSATTGGFVTLTVTRTIGAGTNSVVVFILLATGSTVYLDNAMLVIGPAPAPYQPLHPQEELARCQRYYEVHGGLSGVFPDLTQYASAGAEIHRHSYVWHVQKGGAPTVTKNGTWAVLNCGQPSVGFGTVNGYTLVATSTAAGLMSFSPNSGDDTVTAEYNPP